MAKFPEAGITFMKGAEYFDAVPPVHGDLTEEKALELGLEQFKLLGKQDFPDDKVTYGYEYKTWCLNPMIYCSFLLRQFHILGGQIMSMELRDANEAFLIKSLPGVQVVVNCSGVGFNDAAVFPTRGKSSLYNVYTYLYIHCSLALLLFFHFPHIHTCAYDILQHGHSLICPHLGQTCLVSNPSAITYTRQYADGTWSFCIPRNFHGGTIIGGTKEPDNWDPEPSADTRARLLSNAAANYPALVADGPLQPLGDIVGRRPTRRGGIRLESEEIPAGDIKGLQDDAARSVIHAYGLGGRGYELSWGVAAEVLELVKQRVSSRL